MFKNILIVTFNEQCDSALYVLKYYLVDPMVEHKQIFGTLPILDSSSHDNFKVHTKHTYKKGLTSRMDQKDGKGRRDEEKLQ